MIPKDEAFFDSQSMFICDQISLKILDSNEAASIKFGQERSDLIGRKLTDFCKEVDLSKEPYSISEDGFSGFKNVWKVSKKKTADSYVQFSSHLISYKGNPAKIVVAHDVTNVVKEKSIHADIVSYPLAFQNFPMAEIEWNMDLKVLRWSDKAEALFGWTQKEAIERTTLLKEFVHPEDIDFVRKELSDTIKGNKKNVTVVNRNITKSGVTIHCEWNNSFLFDADGNIVSIYSLVSDITARVNALEQSRRISASYRDLFDSISDAIYLLNWDGMIVEANNGLKLTYGYDPKEVIGKNYRVLSAPGKFDSERFFQIKKRTDHEGIGKFEGWGKRANGEVFPTQILVNKGSYNGEDILIVIERDISEQKDSEAELKKREHLFSELFNSTPIAIALLSDRNEIVLVNTGFEKTFQYKLDEIQGLEIDRLIVSEEDFKVAKFLSDSTKVEEVVCKRHTKNGDELDVITYAVPIIIEGKMIAKYGIYVDITETKSVENQLLNSLKEKEVLLAEIHHRVKNNLAVITGLLELQSYDTQNKDAKMILNESRMRINSIALVHEKLYQNDFLSKIDVQTYIKELSLIVKQTMGLNSVPVEIAFDLDDVSFMITQAIPCGLLLNEILTNSFKHAFVGKESGTIHIIFKENEGEILFSVRDDGVGIDNERNIGENSSLGLKLIDTLSRQLSAEKNIFSDNGTVFEFRFKKLE